jgi:MFS family permease
VEKLRIALRNTFVQFDYATGKTKRASLESNAPQMTSQLPEQTQSLQDAAFRKVTLRLVPLLFASYVFNYMDRTNIGFAQLQMKSALGFSAVTYGLGASIFFVSYAAFALPSNLLMTKIGARKTIFGSLFLWGIASAATMFVRTPREFYTVRFVLGVVEAGFFPGAIYYLTKWFPSHRRAKANGLFQSATVIAGVISGVLSGALITDLNGFVGLRGWQWMFLVEGLPSAILGIIVLIRLDDDPGDAKWLSVSEKKIVVDALRMDSSAASNHQTLSRALADWRVYLLGLIFFLAVLGTYVLAFWQPIMIKEMGVTSIMAVGLYSTIPAAAAVISKIWIGHHSDKSRELRWHFAISALAGAAGMLLMPMFPHSQLWGIACLTLATAGVHGCIPIFWSVPGLYLSGTAAAGGIAVISTMGNLSGAVGPAALGFIRNATGRFDVGLQIVAGLLLLGGVLLFALLSKRRQLAVLATASSSTDLP